MLKVTTRYICFQFIPSFLLSFVFFVAFLNTFYMFRILSLIVDKGVELKIVLFMLLNLSLSFFPIAMPISVFFATIYVLNKLSEDSEIIAMRSFGISKFSLYFPILLLSSVLSIGLFSLNSVLIPKANADFKNTIVKLTSSGMLTSIKSGQFFTDIPGTTLFAQVVSSDGQGFTNVFLHLKGKTKADGHKIIFAKSGTLIKMYADEWHAPSLRLHLKEGNIIHQNAKNESIEKVLFSAYDFPVFNSDFSEMVLDKDSMKTSTELQKVIGVKKQDYLTAIPSEVKAKKKLYYKSLNEFYSRFLAPIQIIIFSFIGFCLGIKKGRGKGRNNSATAAVILLSYFGLYFLFLSLSQKGNLYPEITSFVPPLILFILGMKYYKDLDWAS